MDTSDLNILPAIKGYFESTPIIFDIGANKGAYTDFILGQVPDAKIILIEPNDLLAYNLKVKYSWNKNIDIINCVVGKDEESVIFYQLENNNDELSSIIKREVFDDLKVTEVVKGSETIDNLIEDLGKYVDFIKVDTEGAEFDVLKGASDSLKNFRIDFIQIEYGGTYPDAGITMKEIILFVNNFWYDVYSVYENGFYKLSADTFIEDFHYDNYLITHLEMSNAS